MTVPDPAPPTSRQLLRSTLIALLLAGAILVTIVLPAEYGRDPTGIGRILGLTEMGEIKMALAEEAAANAAALASTDSIVAASEAATGGTAVPPGARADTVRLTLAPGRGAEVKLDMAADARARYRWVATGAVNYDLHGDSAGAPAGWFVSYRKGMRVAADSGELVAGFSGSHGWFWRNRSEATVEIRLVTSGEYQALTRP